MKGLLVKFLRKKFFQPLWETLFHFSKIFMNYWGGADLFHSGEIYALKYISKKLASKEMIVAFDVGANQGAYTLLATKSIKNVGKVYSFEPSKKTFELLVNNTLSFRNIQPVNFGLGEKSDVRVLFSSGHGSAIASVYDLNSPTNPFQNQFSEEIQIRTIDSFCHEEGIGFIDFLKLDIEGHELFALKGASDMIQKKRIRFIQFEFGECHIDSKTFFRDFYDFFGEDYLFYRIVSNGLRRIKGYSTDLEVFSTANFLVELKEEYLP